jgi:hypothetical protein
MAAEKVDLRDVNVRQVFPWTELFRGFQVALDPKKLLLAAAGLLVMSLGWWLLSVIFMMSRTAPDWNSPDYNHSDPASWHDFKEDLGKWNLLYAAAGAEPRLASAEDLANDPSEIPDIRKEKDAGKREFTINNRTVVVTEMPYGKLRTLPWFEDRGPNPYLLITGQAGHVEEDGTVRNYPWERGLFWDWLITKQVPVLIEPLVKFLRPIIYLLHPQAGFWNRLYFLLALIWSLAVWAVFGGAITRMAAVQIARKEKIGLGEALRFTISRYLSYFSAPLIPLIFVVVVVLFLIIFGVFHLIPLVGDIVVDGLGWVLVLLAGLAMAVVLVGLVGWPMMYATISAEGSDSFDALSRSYSYVYQSPWQYIWYALVSLVYGALVVFFIGFMGSLTVYLGKWGVGQTPFIAQAHRQPEFLFVYAPTSFGWRDLLLHATPALNAQGAIPQDYWANFRWYNYIGAYLVGGFWLYLVFLIVVGFGYSYFWSASTIIYLLMRRKVDDTEMDEIYLEDDEPEEVYRPQPASAGGGESGTMTMVDSPGLKTASTGSTAAPGRLEPSVPKAGDGNPPVATPAAPPPERLR